MRIPAIAQLLLCYVVAASAQLTITPLPDILFQNNSGVHNIVEQSVIWLYCTVDSATATITWTKDGETLVNDPTHIRIRSFNSSEMSTTSSLVVDNFQTSDNGTYVCQARDGMLTTSSSTLSLTTSTNTLTVVNPADSDDFPDNRIAVSVGGNQVLMCVGTGSSGPPSVVWVRNGEQVVNGGRITITETMFSLQRDSRLTITNFALSDAGVYQCIFTEGAAVITTTPLRLDTGDATLERLSPPVIVLDPPEKLVIETRASGGYSQFEWQRNRDPFRAATATGSSPFIVTIQEFSNFFEIFVRDPTNASDLGVYEVELIGAQVPELDFTVTPYIAPATMNLNGTVTVQEGDSVNIVCVSSGNPVPTISWYLGTSPAPFSQSDSVEDYQAEIVGTFPNDMFSFTEGNITSVLQITNAVYPAHDGEYTCVGLNSHRTVDNTNNATITVQVQAPPEVEVTATLTRVVVGNSTTLTCTVTRSNPMGSYTYRWMHNNSITLPGETSSMLTVSILSESNLGVYLCEVINSANLTGSNTTTIELGDPPGGTIIQPGSVPPVVIGQSVDLMCAATGDPPIIFTWVLRGEENTRLNSDPTSGNFTLTITQVNQYGVYICITTNNLGTDAASVDIIQATEKPLKEPTTCSLLKVRKVFTIWCSSGLTASALFQLRLKPVRECVTWVDERRGQKFMDIVSAVVQQVQMRCSCNFTETNIQNYEFSCRSIENTVVFSAAITYTGSQQGGNRAEDLVTLVSGWAQSETSIVVDSTRLVVDPTCPTQLRSFQDDDCQLVLTDPTGTDIIGNVATVAALGGALGVIGVLLTICSIILIVFVVQKKRKQRGPSPKNETCEIPQLPLDDGTGKDSQARPENVITSSNPAYGYFQTSRQEYDSKEDKEGKGLDQIDEAYEIPHLSSQDDTSVKTNPARSENVITSSNPAYGSFQISRQEYD